MDHLFIKGKRVVTEEDKILATALAAGMIKPGEGFEVDADGVLKSTELKYISFPFTASRDDTYANQAVTKLTESGWFYVSDSNHIYASFYVHNTPRTTTNDQLIIDLPKQSYAAVALIYQVANNSTGVVTKKSTFNLTDAYKTNISHNQGIYNIVTTQDLARWYGDKVTSQLQTQNKSTLVDAINEILDKLPWRYSMPTPSSAYVSRVIQYTGPTTSNFTQNYFYRCVSQGTTAPYTYVWEQVDVQPSSGGGGGGGTASVDERFINSSLYSQIIANAQPETSTPISDLMVLADLKNALQNASTSTMFQWGTKGTTERVIEDTKYISYQIDSNDSDITYLYIGLDWTDWQTRTDYEIHIAVSYNSNTDVVTASLSKYPKTSGSQTKAYVTLTEKIYNNTSLGQTDIDSLFDLYTSLISDPKDLVVIVDGTGAIYEATYKTLTRTGTYDEKDLSLFFKYKDKDAEITFRSYYNDSTQDAYLSLYAGNSALEYIHRDLVSNYLRTNYLGPYDIENYRRVEYDDTYLQVDTTKNVNGGLTFDSTRTRFETRTLDDASYRGQTIKAVINESFNNMTNYDDMPYEMHVRVGQYPTTGSTTSNGFSVKLIENGNVVLDKVLDTRSDTEITLTDFLNYSTLEIEITPLENAPLNSAQYVEFYTYIETPKKGSVASEANFKSNLENMAQQLIQNGIIDNEAYVVDVPDAHSNPVDYTTIIAKTLLKNIVMTPGTNPDTYSFDFKSELFEYNYNANFLHITFDYDENAYGDKISNLSVYINGVGVDQEVVARMYNTLETVVNELFGLTLNWNYNYGSNPYLDYYSSFNEIKITNVNEYNDIKLTFNSTALQSPLVTTLAKGQSLTLNDVGITYDSIKAEWANSDVTDELYQMSDALHVKWTV